MTILPLEQQAFGRGFLGASQKAMFLDRSSDRFYRQREREVVGLREPVGRDLQGF